jgi:hypothetical protein
MTTSEQPGYRCSTCGERFPEERLYVLHQGVRHPEKISPEEQDEFEEIYTEEQSNLRYFRLKAMAALVFLYFGFLMLYVVVS